MYSPYTASHESYSTGGAFAAYHHHQQHYGGAAPRNGLQLPHSSSYPTPQHFAGDTPMQRQRTPNTNTPSAGRTVAGGAGWYQQQHGHHSMQQYPTPQHNVGPYPQKGAWQQQQQIPSTASPTLNHHYSSAVKQQNSQPTVISAATAATTTSLVDRMCPISGKGLERELMCATKEELVQVLLDLCSCNSAASTFIQSKAQLFSLQAAHVGQYHHSEGIAATATPTITVGVGARSHGRSSAAAPTTAAAASSVSHNVSHEAAETPSKELFSLDDSSASWQSRFSSTAKELNVLESPLPASATAGSGIIAASKTPVRRELHERHITPETRPFTLEVHPCLRLYGACRHSVNCIFKTLPRNLCLHWIRGSCAGGADCGCVHRFPSNCPEQVRTVYELSHGGDRTEVAKRAESTAEKVRTSANSMIAVGIAAMGTPVNPRQRTAAHADNLNVSPIPHAADEEDAVTPRNENQRISTLMEKAIVSSGKDNMTAAREAHQVLAAAAAATATAEATDSPTMMEPVERSLKNSFEAAMDDEVELTA